MIRQASLVFAATLGAALGARAQTIDLAACSADQTYSGDVGDHQAWSTSVGYFDGDDYLDVLTVGGVDASTHARLYLGDAGTHGPSCEIPPIVEFTGVVCDPGALWGASVAFLGDVDGQGTIDLAIGAPQANGGEGEVYVFFGEALLNTVSGCGPCSGPCSGTTVVNVSAADVLISGTIANGYFGQSLAGGNFDGNGGADLAIGQPGCLYSTCTPGIRGFVRLFTDAQLTAASTYDDVDYALSTRGDQNGDRLGFSLATIDDVDGDGRPDVLAGAVQAKATGLFTWSTDTGPGYVRILRGVNFRTIRTLTGTGPSQSTIRQFGASVAATPSFSGNSKPEVIVGAPGFAAYSSASSQNLETGGVFLFDSATGSQIGGAIYPMATGSSDPATDYAQPASAMFGWSVAGGDWDGVDGGDLWIGIPRRWEYSSSYAPCGCATVSGVCDDPVGEAWVLAGDDLAWFARYRGEYGPDGSDKQRLGWSIASGDVDDDGETDSIVGSMSASTSTAGEAGRVHVFLQP